MSEREQNKEREPLMETCDNCDYTYEHTDDNSRLVFFTKQPECNYIVCQCPQCNTGAVYFMDEAWQENALKNDIPVYSEGDYAPTKIYDMWIAAQGIELAQEFKITTRHEEIIRRFGETLTAMTVADPEGFWADMNSPQHRPYPLRWN